MTFVGRKAEMEALGQAHRVDASSFVPIYGRRRVGKSELILRFMQGKDALYYLGKTAPGALQAKELLRQAARALDEPLLAEVAPDDWKHVLGTVVDRYRGDGKLVLALDEFQWMAAASPELPSVIQELWDTRWKKSKKVMLILCGSYIGFMEREVLGKKSPLFGRRTAQILLEPLSYREAGELFPSWSLVDRAKAYFICGGVPFYLECFDERRSIEANLEKAVLDEFGPLFREPDFLLREELREVDNYFALLQAIARGAATNVDIARSSGIPERSLHYYLQQLVDLRYVRRRHPLTGKKPAQRHVRFGLDDALLRFWFRFVFPNLSFVQQMGARRTLRERIRPELDAYFGSCFERLCREALPHIYEREGVPAAFEVGEYWDNEVQIDVVGVRDDHWIDLGECKWGRVRSRRVVEEELTKKLERYPNPRGATLGRRIFTKDAPPGESNSPWYDLAALYR